MPVFSFSIALSFEWPRRSKTRDQRKDRQLDTVQVICEDKKKADLSPFALQLQEEVRKAARTDRGGEAQLRRERMADAESLHFLEAATAANSNKAKKKDRESLEVLIHHTTSGTAKHRALFKTPDKTSFWPIDRPAKLVNQEPLSDAGSFTTPSSVRKAAEIETSVPKGMHGTPRSYIPSFETSSSVLNELGAQRLPTGESATLLTMSEFQSRLLKARRIKSDDFSPESRKAVDRPHGSVMSSAYIQEQAESVFEWMDKLKALEQNNEAERAKKAEEAGETEADGKEAGAGAGAGAGAEESGEEKQRSEGGETKGETEVDLAGKEQERPMDASDLNISSFADRFLETSEAKLVEDDAASASVSSYATVPDEHDAGTHVRDTEGKEEEPGVEHEGIPGGDDWEIVERYV